MSLEDYIGFLRRALWKTYQEKKRWETVGKYLEILQTVPTPLPPDNINSDK